MSDNLFEGLPPPSNQNQQQVVVVVEGDDSTLNNRKPSPPPQQQAAAVPVLKSALKRSKPIEPNPVPQETAPEKAAPPGKRLRFKTTTDASEKQVIEAMEKIASHIKNPSKFAKASKLAIQLVQAESVKPGTSDHFFAILEAAMSSGNSCTDPSLRADYHALFSVAQDAAECLNKKQKHQLATWRIRAVVANDLYTDDSFVFSRTAVQIKDAINSLPGATEDDDIEETAALKDETGKRDEDSKMKNDNLSSTASAEEDNKDESDPFGLNAFLSTSKKDERAKGKKDTLVNPGKEEEEENKRFLKAQRESLIICLEIAAHRYKIPWCQTVIDILVKHAFDNVARFTSLQRDAIEKLWASIREQQTRRKQGKSVNGKLDVTAFEYLQEKYSTEKISIRHSVGGSGDRRAQQWLG